MSDLDKLFENAPEGAVAIQEDHDGILYWVKGDGEYWDNGWEPSLHNGWQTIATRPQPERKTVEDAVEYFNGEWPHKTHRFIYHCNEKNIFTSHAAEYRDTVEAYKVCTREEFEACVAAKSEPEWTHVFLKKKCRIVCSEPDDDGCICILRENTGYVVVEPSKLNPIKPTISKDAKAQLELYVQYRIDKYGDYETKKDLLDYLSHHNITN
mgnify:CR=1 FL=1